MKCPKSLGEYVKTVGNKVHYLVAGAASDNAEKETPVIDRLGYQSAVVAIPWNAIAVTDAKKLTLTVKRYQSANGTDFDAAETIKAATDVFTAADPKLAAEGLIEIDQDLSGCKRYVKYSVTADLNASGTDTAAYGVMVTLGGAELIPA